MTAHREIYILENQPYIYICKNNRGPNIVSCGIPVYISSNGDLVPSYSTYFYLSDRYKCVGN